MGKKLGLIAGGGRLPSLVAEAAQENGYEVIGVAIEGEALPSLESAVDRLFWIRIGELDRMIRALKGEGVDQVVMVGKVQKRHIYSDIKPDLRAALLFFRLKERNDDAILKALCQELEREGIEVVECTRLVSRLLAPQGVLTTLPSTPRQRADIEFGRRMAKIVAGADIGQTVVVKAGAVVAVEAIEGTNEAIRRGAELAGPGTVVVKVARPQQDLRLDVPVVGPDTVEVMREVGASVLALEAGRVIMVDREEMVKIAKGGKISIVAD